ncbi:hypothetical protein [Nocardia transvalensis]|uniref:hypothetical protein n=1 Tax=Nocardia transvalensis TaxID=37333 RepID=UPI00189385EE|nr:hypothetical protein [Nocardia transvalensis]MBF6331820.1 hypothetical protein [Nocardia transvalensis]
MNINPKGSQRCGDLPKQVARELRAVQLLAKQEAEMIRQAQASGQDLTTLMPMTLRINEIGRVRELAEVAARAAGAPSVWVDRVRRLGALGREWDDNQLLPPPPPLRRRRAAQRVLDDVKQVIDMAVLDAVREHLLSLEAIEHRDEPTIAQYRTNMDVLLARARYTARLGGMTEQEVGRTWERSRRDWRQDISHYLHNHTGDDIDALWGRYASSDIERDARKAIGNLRRELNVAGNPGPNLSPPPSAYLLHQARDALAAELNHDDGAHIATAIGAALPKDLTRAWDNLDREAASRLHTGPVFDAGPDP